MLSTVNRCIHVYVKLITSVICVNVKRALCPYQPLFLHILMLFVCLFLVNKGDHERTFNLVPVVLILKNKMYRLNAQSLIYWFHYHQRRTRLHFGWNKLKTQEEMWCCLVSVTTCQPHVSTDAQHNATTSYYPVRMK